MVKIVKSKDLQIGKIYKFSFGSEKETFMILEIKK